MTSPDRPVKTDTVRTSIELQIEPVAASSSSNIAVEPAPLDQGPLLASAGGDQPEVEDPETESKAEIGAEGLPAGLGVQVTPEGSEHTENLFSEVPSSDLGSAELVDQECQTEEFSDQKALEDLVSRAIQLGERVEELDDELVHHRQELEHYKIKDEQSELDLEKSYEKIDHLKEIIDLKETQIEQLEAEIKAKDKLQELELFDLQRGFDRELSDQAKAIEEEAAQKIGILVNQLKAAEQEIEALSKTLYAVRTEASQIENKYLQVKAELETLKEATGVDTSIPPDTGRLDSDQGSEVRPSVSPVQSEISCPGSHESLVELNCEGLAMNMQNSLAKILKPSPFHGHYDEDGKEFLRLFEEFCLVNDIDLSEPGPLNQRQERLVVSAFTSQMRQAAALWLASLLPEQKATYEELKKAFTARYISPHTTGTRLAEDTQLRSRKLKPNENIEDLYQELAAKCIKMGKSEIELMGIFIQALPSAWQEMLITHDPQNMQQALKMAKTAETMKPLNRKPFTSLKMLVPNETEAEESSEGAVGRSPGASDRDESALDTVVTKLMAVQTRMEKLEADRKKMQAKGASEEKKGAETPERGRLKCHVCGKLGHKSSDCRSKKVSERGKPIICFRCGQEGHRSFNCQAVTLHMQQEVPSGEPGNIQKGSYVKVTLSELMDVINANRTPSAGGSKSSTN